MAKNVLLIALAVTGCAASPMAGGGGSPDDPPDPGSAGGGGGGVGSGSGGGGGSSASLGDHQAPPFTGTDGADADGDGIADALERYLVTQFAPELRLAPDDIDGTRPANVDWYLPRVHMRFDHPSCPDHQILALGAITFDNIWRQDHATSSGIEPFCSHTSTTLPSGSATATFTAHKDFFLQAEDDALVHPGIPPAQKAEWRVYAHVSPSRYVRASDHKAAAYDVQIWTFYAYNDSVGGVNHEGDWEHVTISVTADLDFVSAYYSAHHEGGRFDDPASLSWTDRTHPVGYAADGSHAIYETAGEHPSAVPGFPDHAYDGGPIWQTWSNFANLGERGAILDGQDWARYDGRWGEVGDVEDTSGPVGPMYSGRWLPAGSEY
ncbi:MAG TPA: Vps62-related protein [Kofleriaceae bacterium]|nr:Vps62-related protein [Kofleriaceae bacterium]